MNINEIPAGGGLDALMDERVMRQSRKLNRHYSTNRTDALEIVGFLNRQGFMVLMCAPDSGNPPSCMIYRGAAASYPPRDIFLNLAHIEESHQLRGMSTVRVQAESLSLAICRAALVAVSGSSVLSVFYGPPKLHCPTARLSLDESIGPDIGGRDVVGPHMGSENVIGPYLGNKGRIQVGA